MLIPEENVKDLEEVPENVKSAIEIIPVRWIDKVLEESLVSMPKPLDPVKLAAEHPPVVAPAAEETPTCEGFCAN